MEHQHTHEVSRNFRRIDEELSRIVPPAISAATGGVVLGAAVGSGALVGGAVAALVGAAAGYYANRKTDQVTLKDDPPDEKN